MAAKRISDGETSTGGVQGARSSPATGPRREILTVPGTVLSRLSRFDMICKANNIEHRLTKPNHPWTNGQVKRMNRTIKDATIKRYHYNSHDQLEEHLNLFLDAYNHARRLKTLKGFTPAQFIWKEWQSRPDLFYEEPCHLIAGLNT